MRRIGVVACATLLSLSLIACGGQASSSASNDSSASQAQSSSQAGQSGQTAQADAKTFEGEWKLAAFIRDGATVTGDFTDWFGTAKGNEVTINVDGTGVVVAASTTDFTWKATGDNVISIANEYDPADTTGSLEDGMLTIKSGERPEQLVYTRDGVYPKTPSISFEKTGIPTADQLKGTWKYCALKNTAYENFLAFGDAEGLASIGEFKSGELTFNDDGTGSMLGYAMKWTANNDGVTITIDETGKSVTVIQIENGIACESNVDGAIYAFAK